MSLSFEQEQELTTKYWRKLTKKLKDTPKPMQILQRRTMNTAFSVFGYITGIAFEKLSMSLYFYTKDVQMAEFTRLYESQLELAAIDQDKFAMGLHKFFNNVSIRIKKEDLYQQFFELYYRCIRASLDRSNPNIEQNVIQAYLSLLYQQAEYIKPDKFDYSVTLAGMATDGQLLVMKDFFSNFDLPGYELQQTLSEKGPAYITFPIMQNIYAKYGYKFNSFHDYDVLGERVKFHSSACYAILPFINEYTYDIIPSMPFSIIGDFLLDINVPESHLAELYTALKKRKHTLPTNGVLIKFADNPVIDSLLLKEILYDNTIILLYKYSCVEGDLAGFYDTKNPFFFTKMAEHDEYIYLAVKIIELVLFCYACYTLNDSMFQLNKIDSYFTLERGYKLNPTGYLQGGKLKNTYQANVDGEPREGTVRKGNDDFEKETKAIQGYIRKLPKNQTASQEAREYAEALGYDLNTDETFVRPFIKQVFRLKVKECQES